MRPAPETVYDMLRDAREDLQEAAKLLRRLLPDMDAEIAVGGRVPIDPDEIRTYVSNLVSYRVGA